MRNIFIFRGKMGDTFFLTQLVNSMSDSVAKLEQAQQQNKIEEFNKIKQFILQIQAKINEEVSK